MSASLSLNPTSGYNRVRERERDGAVVALQRVTRGSELSRNNSQKPSSKVCEERTPVSSRFVHCTGQYVAPEWGY